MAQQPKQRGFGWWLGRQIGHIRKAINTPVPAKQVYRRTQVQQQTLAESPNVTLRRVVTDEMIVVEGEKSEARSQKPETGQ